MTKIESLILNLDKCPTIKKIADTINLDKIVSYVSDEVAFDIGIINLCGQIAANRIPITNVLYDSIKDLCADLEVDPKYISWIEGLVSLEVDNQTLIGPDFSSDIYKEWQSDSKRLRDVTYLPYLIAVKEYFSRNEKSEWTSVIEYIDAGEYGLANEEIESLNILNGDDIDDSLRSYFEQFHKVHG